MSENKKPRNEQNQKHGVWEIYHHVNGNLSCRGTYVCGIKNGFWEIYHPNGNVNIKGIYLNERYYGYWEINYDTGDAQIKEFELI